MTCNRCSGTGFINAWALTSDVAEMDPEETKKWIKENAETDAAVCGCCGDGKEWYGEPGHHYGSDDRRGPDGPYAYNGGVCECH